MASLALRFLRVEYTVKHILFGVNLAIMMKKYQSESAIIYSFYAPNFEKKNGAGRGILF